MPLIQMYLIRRFWRLIGTWLLSMSKLLISKSDLFQSLLIC